MKSLPSNLGISILGLIASLFVTIGISKVQASASDCTHTAKSFKCVKYLKNYDADTVTFSIPGVHPLLGEKISIRVLGIDTPEKRGRLPCEKEVSRTAQKLVENLLSNAKIISLHNVGRDKYFRILADIQYDGKDLKEVLLKNGLAYPYFGATKEKRNWCNLTKK